MNGVTVTVGLIALLVACGKKTKPDCDAYADQVTKLGGAGLSESRVSSVRVLALDACKDGEVAPTQVQCVIAASSQDESLRCHGLSSPAAPPSAKPAPQPSGPRVRRSGFSVMIPTGWTEDTSSSSRIMLTLRSDETHSALVVHGKKSDMGDNFNPIASDDACRDAVIKGGLEAKTIISAKVVETQLGKACRVQAKDGATAHVSNMIVVADGALAMSCSYESHEAEPPPACTAILDSLQSE